MLNRAESALAAPGRAARPGELAQALVGGVEKDCLAPGGADGPVEILREAVDDQPSAAQHGLEPMPQQVVAHAGAPAARAAVRG